MSIYNYLKTAYMVISMILLLGGSSLYASDPLASPLREKILKLFSYIETSYAEEDAASQRMQDLKKSNIPQYSLFEYRDKEQCALVVVFNGTVGISDAMYDLDMAFEDGLFEEEMHNELDDIIEKDRENQSKAQEIISDSFYELMDKNRDSSAEQKLKLIYEMNSRPYFNKDFQQLPLHEWYSIPKNLRIKDFGKRNENKLSELKIDQYNLNKRKKDIINLREELRKRHYKQHDSVARHVLTEVAKRIKRGPESANSSSKSPIENLFTQNAPCYDKIIFAGHSLGGSLALYAYSASTRHQDQDLKSLPKEIFIFNSLGLPEALANGMDQQIIKNPDNSTLIEYYHIVLKADILHSSINKTAEFHIPDHDNGILSKLTLLAYNDQQIAPTHTISDKDRQAIIMMMPDATIGIDTAMFSESIAAHKISALHNTFLKENKPNNSANSRADLMKRNLYIKKNLYKIACVTYQELIKDMSLLNSKTFELRLQTAGRVLTSAMMSKAGQQAVEGMSKRNNNNTQNNYLKQIEEAARELKPLEDLLLQLADKLSKLNI